MEYRNEGFVDECAGGIGDRGEKTRFGSHNGLATRGPTGGAYGINNGECIGTADADDAESSTRGGGKGANGVFQIC